MANVIYSGSNVGRISYDGVNWHGDHRQESSVEELAKRDEYLRNKDLLDRENKEKMEALKTIFPRGYSPIDNFLIMVDVAREDQLNPLYEKVLREFEDAQSALHRAANKLASAVKLTNHDEVVERANSTTARTNSYMSHLSGINSLYPYQINTTAANTVLTGNITGYAGATGATGPTGAKGDKGDVGDQGPKGDKGDGAWTQISRWFRDLFR